MLTECFQIRIRFPRKPRKIHCLNSLNNTPCPNPVVVIPPPCIIVVSTPEALNSPRIPATPQPRKRLRVRGNARKRALLKALADG